MPKTSQALQGEGSRVQAMQRIQVYKGTNKAMKLLLKIDISSKGHFVKEDVVYITTETRKKYPCLKRYKRLYTVIDVNETHLKLNTGFWVNRRLVFDYPKAKKL